MKFLIFLLLLFLTSCSITISFHTSQNINCANPKIQKILYKKVKNNIFHNKLKYFTFKYFIPVHKNQFYCESMVELFEGKYSIGWIRFYAIKTDDNKFFVKVFKKLYHERINK